MRPLVLIVGGAVALVSLGFAAFASGSSAPPPKGGGGPMPTIKLGSTGAAVSTWQGVVGVPKSGTFDAATDAATRKYQTDHHLTADGVVGHWTWAAAGYTGTAAPAGGTNAPSSSSSTSAPAGHVEASAGPSSGSSGGGGSGGHAWAHALPVEGSMAQPQILDAVRRGEAIVEWIPLTLRAGGHELEVDVTARTLRVGTNADSVAITVDYDTAQAIAEQLDAYLLTPRVSDAIWSAADLKIRPYPARPWQGTGTDNTGTQTFRMIQHSDEMDAKGVLSAHLVANEGKDWIVSARIWTDPPAKRHNGPNYGFYLDSGDVVQHVGMVHNRKHVDYSQKWRGMRRHGRLDGATVDLRDVVRDPALASLLSNEGRLPDLVHPDLGGAAA